MLSLRMKDWFFALTALGVVAVTAPGCGSKLARSKPLTKMTVRVQHRIGLVDLIVTDAVRAAKVKQTYLDLEQLLLTHRDYQAEMTQRLGQIQAGALPAPDSVTEAYEQMLAESQVQVTAYVALQLQLRRQLTEAEFNTLDKVK